MANKLKTVFISDIHLGAGKKWDWFDGDSEGPHLIKFFQYISERTDIKELVLLGDVFDLWVCPYNETPQAFEDICQRHRNIIRAVKDVADKFPVLYVNGNHDFQVTSDDINAAFEGKVRPIGNVYRRGNVHAEHGHQYALFNCPDMKNGGYLKLPLGYYISRLYCCIGKSVKGKLGLLTKLIDESFQVMGPERLPESALDAFKGAVERNGGQVRVDAFNMGHICDDQTYGAIKDRYRNLFDDWLRAKGYWYTVQMIMCELNRLGTVADRLCRNGVNIVVLGHSHDTRMDRDTWLVQDRIYANCGYWCGLGEPDGILNNAHFVETDGTTVTLNRFNLGDVECVTQYSL